MRSPGLLDRILADRRRRVNELLARTPLDELREAALQARAQAVPHALRRALQQPGVRVIAEFKRRSPSAGALQPHAPVADVARSYEAAGASAMSVLTEPDHFGGSLADLRAAHQACALPLLCKDFILDAAQVYEAAAAGASAVLLIVRALTDEVLAELRVLVEDELGMDALVEVHDRDELARALRAGATLVGINNRNLDTLEISLRTTEELAARAPRGLLLVSESGIRCAEDVVRLRRFGVNAFLVGESLLRAHDGAGALRALVNAEAGEPCRS